MKYPLLKTTLIASVSLFSKTAFAGAPIVAGTMTFSIPNTAINPTAVPSLSGTMLIVLSLLLFVVAFRIANQKNAKAGKFFLMVLGVGALSSGISGMKLVSDVNAGGQETITLNTNSSATTGSVDLLDTTGPNGASSFFINYFDNPYSVPATITAINTPGNFLCSNTQMMGSARPIEPMAPTCQVGNIIQPAGNGASSQCQISCMPDSYFNN